MLNFKFNFFQNFKNAIFPFYKNKELKFLFKKLHSDFPKEKVVARFVGGCVRKHLSGEEIDDIDVATILTSDEIKNKLKNTYFRVLDTGTKHGTVTVISDNFKVEITTLREDHRTDGRHAEVKYIDDWKLDSERRDFTINAIYLDRNGKIFDPQMGAIDLKNKNVKFIGDPQKRIEEDFLRIIRFIRFKIMYDLKLDSTTIVAIKQNLDGIKKISKERILLELLKILELKSFLKISENYHLVEIFKIIFPEFIYLDRIKRLKEINKNLQLNKDILLSVLLIDDKDNHEYFAHKYNVPNKLKLSLEKLAKNLNLAQKNKNFFYKDLLKNIYLNGKNHLITLNILYYACNSKIKLQEFKNTLNQILNSSIPNFDINGEYLKQNGMEEGEDLGKVLNKIEEEWLNNGFKISKERIKNLIEGN